MTAAMPTAALDVRDLDKRFGNVTALAGVDLQVAPGEVVALLGQNGVGKTTLLRTIAGLVRPDAGRVRVAGRDIATDGNAARARLGWALGDEHAWYWRLSGRVNLIVFGRMRG